MSDQIPMCPWVQRNDFNYVLHVSIKLSETVNELNEVIRAENLKPSFHHLDTDTLEILERGNWIRIGARCCSDLTPSRVE